ncbi:MAG: glycosyltransferase, partial [Candidatus Sumerlaeia bacterium]|nr:glycosyltransferase [Candidatus Sumerlaeia bacterium]
AAAALLPPSLPRGVTAWYSPHYATCLRPPVPLVCHVQDLLHLTHPPRRGTPTFMRLHLAALRRRAVYTLVTTRHVKTQLQTLHRFPPEKVLLTSLGPGEVGGHLEGAVDLPALESLDGRPCLLAAGIVKNHKNWPFLFRRLASGEWADHVLVCAGTNGDSEKLRAIAAKCGFDPRRLVVAPHLQPHEVACLYKHARALVYPSVAEGFGFPILEAMAMGTPVVHANLSPMKEIAAGAGFPFDPDWPESFDAALREALSGGESVNLKLERGRIAARQYSWDKTAGIVAEVLLSVSQGVYPTFNEAPPIIPQ